MELLDTEDSTTQHIRKQKGLFKKSKISETITIQQRYSNIHTQHKTVNLPTNHVITLYPHRITTHIHQVLRKIYGRLDAYIDPRQIARTLQSGERYRQAVHKLKSKRIRNTSSAKQTYIFSVDDKLSNDATQEELDQFQKDVNHLADIRTQITTGLIFIHLGYHEYHCAIQPYMRALMPYLPIYTCSLVNGFPNYADPYIANFYLAPYYASHLTDAYTPKPTTRFIYIDTNLTARQSIQVKRHIKYQPSGTLITLSRDNSLPILFVSTKHLHDAKEYIRGKRLIELLYDYSYTAPHQDTTQRIDIISSAPLLTTITAYSPTKLQPYPPPQCRDSALTVITKFSHHIQNNHQLTAILGVIGTKGSGKTAGLQRAITFMQTTIPWTICHIDSDAYGRWLAYAITSTGTITEITQSFIDDHIYNEYKQQDNNSPIFHELVMQKILNDAKITTYDQFVNLSITQRSNKIYEPFTKFYITTLSDEVYGLANYMTTLLAKMDHRVYIIECHTSVELAKAVRSDTSCILDTPFDERVAITHRTRGDKTNKLSQLVLHEYYRARIAATIPYVRLYELYMCWTELSTSLLHKGVPQEVMTPAPSN
ncbi:VP5 [Lutzomyia reovirus 1]|uniref:VP5 n=1 Tax=Lutzomyia reovirus 1 TaxID=1670669 RepID=UPI00065EE909|nr:VP5 [Lutzomyia reovirus 1]AKP18606.1 VP5 [Lutzomyia reovirus 1]